MTNNRERCRRARKALAGYRERDDSTECNIIDVLSDLRHLCDSLNLDFAQLDRIAYRHYVEERRPGR